MQWRTTAAGHAVEFWNVPLLRLTPRGLSADGAGSLPRDVLAAEDAAVHPAAIQYQCTAAVQNRRDTILYYYNI
jgi:hypothetical protein